MCLTCYNADQKKRLKEKNQREKKKIQNKKDKERKQLNLTKIQELINKIVRLSVTKNTTCITCNNYFDDVRKLNAGHCFSAKIGSTRFYLKNINPQCSFCNANQTTSGHQIVHFLKIEEKYGSNFSKFLLDMSKLSYKFSRPDLSELRDKCLETINALENAVNDKNKSEIISEFIDWQESSNWFLEIETLLDIKNNNK